MEKYDVIIVGAGIAGTGLAYNLKRINHKGKILVIDKEEPGSNIGYGYRNTFENIMREYELPYAHEFKGLKLCLYDQEYIKMDNPFYFIDYQKSCDKLIKRSNVEFRKEYAIDIVKKTLITNNNQYKFNYLIDCSGNHFFLSKIVKKSLPFMYWVGEVNIYKADKYKKGDYFYFLAERDGFVKDIYQIGDKIVYGRWKYDRSKNLNINYPKSKFCEDIIKDSKILTQKSIILPASPSLPLVYKNYAFLGDSFGNATSASGEGIRPILDSSKILARAIKNRKIKSFEKRWKKKYLDLYIRQISIRKDPKNRFKVIKYLKNHPDIMLKIIKNEKVDIPRYIKKKFPKKIILKQMYNYLTLKLKYAGLF